MEKKEIAKSYDFKEFEDIIYHQWETSGYFNPDNLSGEPYTIMMPPPNVTGVLHLGHALENSLMDVMARYQRLLGKKVLLVPGTDHAAIATQAKVEKMLMAGGITNPRAELGREGLLIKVREYAEQSKATIISQIRKMGTSCDWSRLAYTFDEVRSKAVNEVFVRMYNDGLIYRGYRVVNWSVIGQSTCSDDELNHVDREAKLYTFKYSQDFPITIATTRPETKLGDTAVAVHPADERYQRFIGQTFTVDVGAATPLEIKIIADESVDPKFGTGALGVTPAHSMVDYEMYVKQKTLGTPIGMVAVIDQFGKMTEAAGQEYTGLSVLVAREKFVGWLKEQGLLIAEEDITQSVGTSDRFGDVVESLPMTQWFVDVNKPIPGKDKNIKELLIEVLAIGHNGDAGQKIEVTPTRYEKIYFNWINQLRDWCISRQIWWGHRIPVWYRGGEQYCGLTAPEGEGWQQDEDTLDTWFSSGMWTFSTLGWSGFEFDKTNDLKTFHPTSWMQMGYEIFFLWMIRMILMSLYTLNEIPFKQVYIHGMLRDASGKKFSKSSGNNIDPLEVVAQYGTDALRFSLLNGVTPGNDSRFYLEKVEAGRNLVNKLWNIARYITSSGLSKVDILSISPETLSAADCWILHQAAKTILQVSRDMEACRFSQACETLRQFTWDDLADWYLEASKFEKSEAKQIILQRILSDLLILWHPFMPFVTEAIWQEMLLQKDLIISQWPNIDDYKQFIVDEKAAQFELAKVIIIAIRNARSEHRVEPSRKLEAIIHATENKDVIINQLEIITALRTGLGKVEFSEKTEKVENAILVSIGSIEIYLIGAIDAEKEKVRLEKDLAAIIKRKDLLSIKLSNQEFIAKAPAAIIAIEQQKLAVLRNEQSQIEAQLSSL
ncbi:MAG: valine--tRNA ligase [Candidatus Falkowbacteria bacterium]